MKKSVPHLTMEEKKQSAYYKMLEQDNSRLEESLKTTQDQATTLQVQLSEKDSKIVTQDKEIILLKEKVKNSQETTVQDVAKDVANGLVGLGLLAAFDRNLNLAVTAGFGAIFLYIVYTYLRKYQR